MKRFKMIDEPFICNICGYEVKPLGYTARDHCPSCLCSIHVDNNPGDRACQCLGTLRVISWEKGKHDDIVLVYKCDKCGMIKKNKFAQDDNYDHLLEIIKES